MGIDNSNWSEDDTTPDAQQPDFPIPLPPPPIFSDIRNNCTIDDGFGGEPLANNNLSLEEMVQDNLADSTVSDGKAGVCGLSNLGNTCFMSTGIQCLIATPSLVNCLLDKNMFDNDNDVSSGSLTSQLALLTNKMWSGNFTSVLPSDFKHSLGCHFSQFKDFRQHDCQEFLALLLDGLHEQMNTAKLKPLSPLNNDKSILKKNDLGNNNKEDNFMVSLREKLDNLSNRLNSDSVSAKEDSTELKNSNYKINPLNNKEVLEDIDNILSSTSTKNKNIFEPDGDVEKKSKDNCIDSDCNEMDCNISKNSDEKNSSNDKSDSNIDSLNVSVGLSDSSKSDVGSLDKSETRSLICWNSNNSLTDIQDIIKDAKTSNVNVLVTDSDNSNDIKFDSDKFPRGESLLRRDKMLNFNEFHINDNNSYNNSNNNNINSNPNGNGKRLKTSITHYNCVSDNKEELDLKRIKTHGGDCDSFEKEKNEILEYENLQSKSLDINLIEKNLRIECVRKHKELNSNNLSSELLSSIADVATARSKFSGIDSKLNASSNITSFSENHDILDDDENIADAECDNNDNEGETVWEKHLAMNQSVIVDTFQGQFKSTVVCSACKYISVTYEPFMYLSVPLPHAMERQICVTFIPLDSGSNPIQYLITLNKRDKILELKKILISFLKKDDTKEIILAEVFDNHVAKILNDNHLIRYVDDIHRSIYAFELTANSINNITETSTNNVKEQTNDSSIQTSLDAEMVDTTINHENGAGDYIKDSVNVTLYSKTADNEPMNIEKSCTICLEEKDSKMKRHHGCDCVLCDCCIETSFQHYGGESLMCPVCRKMLNPKKDLIPVEHDMPFYPAVKVLLVPIVYRVDMLGDGNNNQRSINLFGHPNIIRLCNNITSQELYNVIRNLIPYPSTPFKILLVDGQGRHCSRCMFSSHCRGCPVNNIEGSLNLTTGDTLAVTFSEHMEELVVERHISMSNLRPQKPLSLYDCIRAFSKSEVLDKQNPWYCPECKQNQCATKTLSVWRCPDYVIVYLKRFVFHDGQSTKLEDKVVFPHCGLNIRTSQGHTTIFDLYACVCHIGGVSAGHYTAYTQHSKTGEWYYYNDDRVTKQTPQEEDYCNAYILFYKKRDSSKVPDINVHNDGGEGCSSFDTI